ncbi:ABC transporter permease [Dactylosporangium fulvum]|uniref:ABC transporter permease n=1 Tax=Dactylosporangium fulvum TaxID=53359 RepID=A0ABY5WCL1_9ACTN|nr:ABC transporter permease [Dactylosporangium fulvum]UWP86443.1 ABC transporter permease [Dactylosporangium fulvum]
MTMTKAIARRLLEFLIVFFGVTFLIYAAVYALPGDPVASLAGDRPLPANVMEALRAKYHLDEPLWQRYLDYLKDLLHLDFGTTFAGDSVRSEMASRWPVTIALASTAWLLELLIGIGLGAIAAVKRGTWIDKGILAGTVLLSAVPVFVVGVTCQLVFGVKWHMFPIAGTTEGWPRAYLLPSLVIAAFGLAAVSRLTRESMINSLHSDYIRAAKARGVPPTSLIGKHVMRNSMIPTVTFLATDLGYLLGGAVVVEGIFNLPGIGNLLFTSIRTQQGPTVVGIATALILIFLVTSIIVDIIQAALDPRTRGA